MGYVELIEIDMDGVTATDLSDLSDKVRNDLWIAIIRGDYK